VTVLAFQLKKKLTEYGIDNIEEITLMEDPQQEGTNRGFAFLEFPTHLEATNAFKRLQKRDVFFGIDLCAKVAFAKSGIEPDEEVMAQVIILCIVFYFNVCYVPLTMLCVFC
jgi:RNA recognition motif-containing protein